MSNEPSIPSDTGLRCPSCGYNITALTSARCPECGSSFELAAPPDAQPQKPSSLQQLLNLFYVAGTVLIVASWFRVVDYRIGWIGFGMAMLGWVVNSFSGPRRRV